MKCFWSRRMKPRESQSVVYHLHSFSTCAHEAAFTLIFWITTPFCVRIFHASNNQVNQQGIVFNYNNGTSGVATRFRPDYYNTKYPPQFHSIYSIFYKVKCFHIFRGKIHFPTGTNQLFRKCEKLQDLIKESAASLCYHF